MYQYPLSGFAWDTIITHKTHFLSFRSEFLRGLYCVHGFCTPRDPFFHVFWPKLYAGNAKFIKTRHFMNRSVRRHLNEQKHFFLIFPDFSLPPGVTQNCGKNLDFHVFTSFWLFLSLLTNLNMKNQLKQKFFLKYSLNY
jgi:hypothetical protein